MVYFRIDLKKKKEQTQTRWRLKMSLSCTEWLGQHQTKLNTIPLVNFKLATETHLDIILLYGQVIHIPYRKIFMSCIWSSNYNSWRLTSLYSHVYDTNEKKILLVSRSIWSYPFHGEVKTSFDDLHWIDSGQKYRK